VDRFVCDLFGRLGGKWWLRTLQQLTDGPRRFTVLMAALPGISHRVLTVTLRTLEDDGLVSRTAYAETPPRVEYALTPLGRSFLDQTTALVGWVRQHRPEIEAHRSARHHGEQVPIPQPR
jgi:DNA-binding HxlR family transcriptional regulator